MASGAISTWQLCSWWAKRAQNRAWAKASWVGNKGTKPNPWHKMRTSRKSLQRGGWNETIIEDWIMNRSKKIPLQGSPNFCTLTHENKQWWPWEKGSEQPKLRALGRTSNKNHSSQRKSPRSRENTKVKNGGLKQDAKIGFSLKS
jgi:hypothetical protein